MGELFSVWRFALRRFASNWALMLLLAAGALLATTLLATAPIYTDAMSDIGLRFRLDRELDEPSKRVPNLYVDGLRLADPVQLAQTRAFEAVTEARIGWLGNEVLTEQRTDPLTLQFASADTEREQWRARLIHVGAYEQHVAVVDGRLPAPDATAAEVVLLEAFRGVAALGERVQLTARSFNDCRRVPASEDENVAAEEVRCQPTTFVRTSIEAEIVGFVRPSDPADLRWQVFEDRAVVPGGPGQPDDGPQYMPLLTSGAYFNGPLTAQMPELRSRYSVGLVADLDGIAVRDVSRALDDLGAWPRDVRDGLGLEAGGRVEFATALARFRNASTFSQVPLLLLLLQVAGVVGFYLVVVTSLARERQAAEVAVYRSRGASTSQLLGLNLAEGLLIAVPAALLGPLLARLAVGALGYTPAFSDITGGAPLRASVSEDAFLLAAGGAALALAAMLLPTIGAVRRAVVDARREQARPAGHGWIRRYYLDLALVALAALLFWQLDRRGAVFDPQSVGGWQADPLLLLSPLVMTAAAAAMVLRVYSPLLRLAAWLLSPLRGTAVTLGIGRAGRDPAAGARLLLLVLTAIAVGAFAASYAPTVARSFEDRAHYEHGVDMRAAIANFDLPSGHEGLDRLRATEGVEQAVAVHRGSMGVPRGGSVPLLAIQDGVTAASMLSFREDFADEPVEQLLGHLDLGVPLDGGIALPDDTVALAIHAYSEQPPRIARLRGSVRDGNGDYHDVIFSGLETGVWTELRTDLPPGLTPPLALAGLRYQDRRVLVLDDGAIFFDDLTALRANGAREVVEHFEDRFGWAMYSQAGAAETFGPSGDRARSGTTSARWTWTREIIDRARVIAPEGPHVPLNAILSENALARFGVRPGDRAFGLLGDEYAVPLIVRATAEVFPTLDPAQGFVLVDYEQFRAVAGAIGSRDQQIPTEIWVDFGEEVPLATQQAIVDQARDGGWLPFEVGAPLLLAERLDEIASDPTVQASGSGILLLAFAGAMGAAVLGFVVSLAITLHGRTVELAVLRSLGASSRGLLRALVFEWGVVLLFGSVIGVLLGRWISRLMLQFLEVTETGDPVVPAFAVETEWRLLSTGIALLAVAAAATLWTAWRAVLRRGVPDSLRLTQ
ncbi:MAG: FtsX-like permease family protein [Chloroflexi bacterium]|nr:FtsX-like permease family protein [Chloroflexota bacterium]